MVELKFVAQDDGFSLKDVSDAMGIKIEDQYHELDNILTNLYRLQKLGGYLEDSSSGFSPRNNWEKVKAAIRKTTGKGK